MDRGYDEVDPTIVLQQNDAYCTRVQLQQYVSENGQRQQQYVHYTETNSLCLLLHTGWIGMM